MLQDPSDAGKTDPDRTDAGGTERRDARNQRRRERTRTGTSWGVGALRHASSAAQPMARHRPRTGRDDDRNAVMTVIMLSIPSGNGMPPRNPDGFRLPEGTRGGIGPWKQAVRTAWSVKLAAS
ncbi:hypothetical protein GCM10023158_37380 [Gluconacetobacter tumulicola]